MTTGNSLNTLKRTIAEKLEKAAISLGKRTEAGRDPGPYNRQVSEWLHHSAEYVRELDIKKADLELRNRIRTHPGKSILAGLTAGLLIGLWLRRH